MKFHTPKPSILTAAGSQQERSNLYPAADRHRSLFHTLPYASPQSSYDAHTVRYKISEKSLKDNPNKMYEPDDDRSVKAPSLIHSFTVIVLLLCSISVFNFTVRSLLGSGLTTERKPVNLLFDHDATRNWTHVCPYLTKKTVHIKWKNTPCFNKTLSYRYIPWKKVWTWNNLNRILEERKKVAKRLADEKKLSEAAQIEPSGEPINEENSTKPEIEDSAKESSSSVVYTILTAMTLMLAIIAGLELFREKLSKKPVDDSKDDRRCSLAEFTIKRHLRKESQENLQRQAAFDEPKKVKEFLHQGSLDSAILNPSVRSRLPRQRSVPTSCVSQQFRNPSGDLSEDDGSPSMRRKSRHFIRRH